MCDLRTARSDEDEGRKRVSKAEQAYLANVVIFGVEGEYTLRGRRPGLLLTLCARGGGLELCCLFSR